jgi:hypothetical protein
LHSYSDWIFNFIAETPAPAEEKRLATWGTDVPDGLVLDQKRLAEALKKVNLRIFYLFGHLLLVLLDIIYHRKCS